MSSDQESQLSVWKEGAFSGIRAFAYLAAMLGLWVIIARLEVFTLYKTDLISAYISVVLFLLAIPVGIFLRMDMVLGFFAFELASEIALLAVLPIILINFILWGIYLTYRRRRKESSSS